MGGGRMKKPGFRSGGAGLFCSGARWRSLNETGDVFRGLGFYLPKEGGVKMKKNGLVICCLVFLSMALVGVSHDSFAWNTYIGISNSEGRRVISNGNFL